MKYFHLKSSRRVTFISRGNVLSSRRTRDRAAVLLRNFIARKYSLWMKEQSLPPSRFTTLSRLIKLKSRDIVNFHARGDDMK